MKIARLILEIRRTSRATFLRYSAAVLCFLVVFTSAPRVSAASKAIEYNRDIRPIFSENCFPCHGTDSAARKAGLRLDRFENATNVLDDGTFAIVPGKPDKSELVRRILATDDDVMPPAKSHKEITPAQRELLKKWIAGGARYEPHWAFIAPQAVPPPRVHQKHWPTNPIDNFILARLEQEKLKPAKEADRRTLIRRVSLDLTGLPPTPAEVEAFVADTSTNAYEKVVDRLLASPAWGEHRAHYWLDAARYGDTHGIHFDNYREMWTYRDWVINAYNRNMPFDQFTVEQLAGDLLPHPTRDQLIASGFNRCNITSNESGLIDEEYFVLYTRDRTETTSQVWLGLTAGCAVCHDHKYDPFPQRDFYSLSAFFNNTTQAAMDQNIKDTPPVIVVPKPEDDARWTALKQDLPDVQVAINQREKDARPDFEKWLTQPDFSQATTPAPTDHIIFRAPLNEGQGSNLVYQFNQQDHTLPLGVNTNWQTGITAAKAYTISGHDSPTFADVGDFETNSAFSYSVWVKLSETKNGAIIARMANQDGTYRGWDFWIENNRPAIHIIHKWPENVIKVESRKGLAMNEWQNVTITYDGSSKAAGVKIYINGVAQDGEVLNNSLTDTIHTTVPFKIGQRDQGEDQANAQIQNLNLFDRELKPAEVVSLMNLPRLHWLVSAPADQRSTNDTNAAYQLWLAAMDRPHQQLLARQASLQQEEKDIKMRGTVAYVMNEKPTPAEAYVLNRGEYDQRREKVSANTPSVLPPMPADAPHNRLGFAQWLVRPENPLTSRVTVNRFWQEIFGTGIVKTAGDFGVAGEMPSHPQLLDWLAVDFRDSGWDVKKFFKLMVMSSTYRQSAVVTPEKLERDPENRLLARGPRFRMDAEMVRDYALAASGLLSNKMGGPSSKPYQPPGIWNMVGLPEGNTREYKQDSGPDLYRRSVYTFWKRQAAPPSMEIFNAPSRETCTVRRERTDTPLQALVTLNDPQFVEAARSLAQLTLEQNGASPEDNRINFMAERLLARPLSEPETKIVRSGLYDLLTHYQDEPAEAAKLLKVGDSPADAKLPAPELAAYTMVANELMNLDEVLNK